MVTMHQRCMFLASQPAPRRHQPTETTMTKVVLCGQMVDFDGAVMLMDDEIREALAGRYASDQDFLDAYVLAHAAKYDGEEFSV